MEVTKKEVRESKEVKRLKIDSAIIEELWKGYERPTDLTGPGVCGDLKNAQPIIAKARKTNDRRWSRVAATRDLPIRQPPDLFPSRRAAAT